ncbi:phosphoglycerate mutase [Youhaiella tibetensis]|jgi:broad specificity phosphatase PhoE|uniref:Histidine phosphatase family protein n=1 Tax=Paradevosia tibetensis TaxID=1447062 RepID=A0A5B9DTL8_9HYPH|nr:histidine phosphatase family protein [Youhaiella tibetensis]QEE22517.1 histidine phosphatase family protein [Youhaiella tibetensis]GGF41582.1 phosphoglycerate mutase [Youhaiella tibetensis]
MTLTLYVTHPEVVIDPAVPTPRWGLNDLGRWRAEDFAARGLIPAGTRFFSSTERKAMDLAHILAEPLGAEISSAEAFGENDRSSTGFLGGDAFTYAVAALFGYPDKSYRGWETAVHAQARIVAAVREALAGTPADVPVVFCGHGCVGTLLKCHLAGRPIRLEEDQRFMGAAGGGNVISIDRERFALLSDWKSMEDFGR